MTFLRPALLALTISVPLTAPLFAHSEVKNPVVMERMKTMEAIRDGMKTLGDMAKGKVPFDADKATAAAAIIAESAEQVPQKFEANEMDPASEALPAIWESFDDFVQKSNDMVIAAKSVGTISNESALGAALGQIGGTCKACHRDYRAKN
ncbi:cytochrome c [Aliiroseovarius sp. F47248L]|uniref:c-type cytochrome n=1 Tax=Aliiroseovarius sp. F47248L TaxID=2926420 RepID=UPI001FF2C6E7|nr:cytochrome c [Aliiroseovarius sp. F47248L]MCK0139806.1 cytochrome c [Aliiroseovarius sp. F47248L]